MHKVLTAAEMREVDRLTTQRYGIPSIILMENAAHAVARVITEKLGGSVKGKSILILCGKGNNGGDGAALARILWTLGANCFVYLIGKVSETSGDARVNFESVLTISESDDANWPNENCLYLTEVQGDQLDGFLYQWTEREKDCFVDAFFGTGLTRPVEGDFKTAIDLLAVRRRFLGTPLFVSVDLPSGVDADESHPIGPQVTPDITVTFTSPKPANVLLPVARSNGELIIADIGTPPGLIEDQPSKLYVSEQRDARVWLRESRFSADSYKNKRGHALLIAGSEDYSGAAVLAANAAIRSGVGLATLVCPASAKAEIATRLLPEVILSTLESDDFAGHLERADAVAVGCGLDANDPKIEKLVRELVENRTKPVIVDAGALWFFNPPGENHPVGETPTPLLSTEGSLERAPLILTPHEGEFLRLLASQGENHPVGETPPPLHSKEGSLKDDRVAAVRDFSQKHGVILVLKGERVLIGEPGGKVVVNPTGNSGLGKAGNGDTLAGILAGFVAQAAKMNIDVFETVVAAVYVAGMAGDVAEKKFGKRVMTASDVRECLTDVFAEFEKN